MCDAFRVGLIGRQSKRAPVLKMPASRTNEQLNTEQLCNMSYNSTEVTQRIIFPRNVGQFGVYVPCEAKVGSTMLIRRGECASNKGKCSRRCFSGWFLYSR